MKTRKVELLKKKLERNQDKWMKGRRGFCWEEEVGEGEE
jgi:hypothetical protein